MQEEHDRIGRRHFLQWGTASGAAMAAGALLPRASAQQRTDSPHGAAESAVVLRSAMLTVTFDAACGLPFEYRLAKTGARLRGNDAAAPLEATVCRRAPWSFRTAPLRPAGHRTGRDSILFRFSVELEGVRAAGFALRYALHESTLTVTLDEVKEEAGFELIDVRMPQLVTVRESDPGAWLAHGDSGGSLAMLADARAGALALNSFWGNVLSTLPVVMLGTAHAMCVQETTAFMDGTTLSVSGDAGARVACLGTDKVHRVNGGACYDLNLGRGLPRNCGTDSTPNLVVEQGSSCRLDFLPVAGDPAKAWIAAGRLVRERMPAQPTSFYNDKYVYGIRCDEPLFPKPSATFAECGEIVARVSALTDHAPQVVHLWGWQFQGKDTGYPAVNVVNERIGGYEGMMALMEKGPALNAHITLSDNYDDAYRSSPAWNDALIARRPDGQLWKSRSWTGEESYILGLAKYMEGPGVERVRYTCERYRLKQTTHVDVLSYYAIRNDWDHEHPASGIRNLREGRYRVLAEFARHGVDVSSEALRYPMIGHISCFWYLNGPSVCPFGGTAIPLVPLIYGRSAVWGLSGAGARGEADFVRVLERFYGACPHSILRADSDPALFLDAFYLGVVPFVALRGRCIEDFERNGNRSRMRLEGDAEIECDPVAKTVRIAIGGADVLRDDAVFCPMNAAEPAAQGSASAVKIACYSIRPQTVEVSVPAAWGASEVRAFALFEDRREPVAFTRNGKTITMRLEARRPVMVYPKA